MKRARSAKPMFGPTIVYVGPSLPAGEARELVPGATILPPAAVGDILRAAHDKRVRRIALIDGYFERMAAVWHKEILVAIEHGIEVWGAASMGALRAAELEDFGMHGVGVVHNLFKRGRLMNPDLARPTTRGASSQGASRRRASLVDFACADDEVAVAHLPAEYGYRAVSDALVNIRATLRQLVGGRVISVATETRLVELARARFYRERTWATLVADARAAKLSEREVSKVESALKLDQKGRDARQLLVRLARTPLRPRRKIRVPRTWALRQLERLILR